MRRRRRRLTRECNEELKDLEQQAELLAEQITTGLEKIRQGDLFVGDETPGRVGQADAEAALGQVAAAAQDGPVGPMAHAQQAAGAHAGLAAAAGPPEPAEGDQALEDGADVPVGVPGPEDVELREQLEREADEQARQDARSSMLATPEDHDGLACEHGFTGACSECEKGKGTPSARGLERVKDFQRRRDERLAGEAAAASSSAS